MNCVIPGANIKVISKAIQALSKIGDELYVEAKKDCLSLRSVNMTTTAYCTVNFFDIFFSNYNVVDPDTNSENSDLVWKVPMKAVLGVFRSHNHRDKKPEFCKIELEQNATNIIFKFKYKHDVTVVRSLYLHDGQIVNVVYSKDSATNHISATAQLFAQILANFQLADDDMSLEVTSNKAVVKNYITGDANVRGIRSQLTLTASEFNNYRIDQEASITFSLKPFRSAIHFAESFNLSVSLDFEAAGKPVAVVIKNPTFEANYVMATLKNDDITQSSLVSAQVSSKGKNKEHYSRIDKANITVQDQQALDSINWDSDFDPQSAAMSKRKYRFNVEDSNDNNNVHSQAKNLLKDKEPKLSNGESNMDKHESEDDDDVILRSPESPHSKRIKTIFGRCYESTFHPAMMDLGELLAPDSDPELD